MSKMKTISRNCVLKRHRFMYAAYPVKFVLA